MDRVVVLKSIGGSFDRGFQCNLSIATEGQPIDLEVLGTLPAQPDLIEDYRIWQASYRQLGFPTRISGGGTVHTGKPRKDCKQAANQLKKHLNHWLQSPSFLPIRDTLLQELQPTDRVRLILQMDDPELQQLPWHAWELLDRYHQIEIALASPGYQSIKAAKSTEQAVRVLAILGDGSGIDIKADRTFLEALPNAEVTFLVEPKQHDLSEQLWNKGWDVLFFAGHSITQDSGYLYINPSEKLAIDDLKYALRRSVQQGLQLAIFNSCDGFGLARNLADLQIPQTIFMREPVPDSVAQAFLKHFLMAFVHEAQPLYLAVRSARERLETSEATFLCASWLPMIFQNLAVQPKTWIALSGQPELPSLPTELTTAPEALPPVLLRSRLQSIAQKTAIVAISSLVTTGLVSWVRHQGWMQPLELKAYDHIMQVESNLGSQPLNSRSMVITIDDNDKQKYGNEKEDLSISSENLLKLIQKLKAANADVIAVDLIRDTQGTPKQFTDPLEKMENLIGACFHTDMTTPGFKPPQGMSRQVGSIDMVQDPDTNIRRHLMTFPADPSCPATQSLAVTAVANYLKKSPQDVMAKLPSLDSKASPAAYQKTKERDSLKYPEYYRQILVHYRATPIPSISMGNVLEERSDTTNLKGKIIFIGGTRTDSLDYHGTPLNSRSPGVFIHAAKANHLLAMVVDGEAPIWVWSEQQEWGWILLWAVIGGTTMAIGLQLQVYGLKRWIHVSVVGLILYLSCIVMFMQRSGWVPLVPTAVTIALTAACVNGAVSHRTEPNSKADPPKLH